MKKFLVVLIIVLICGVLGFCTWQATLDPVEVKQTNPTQTLEVSDIMKDLEGYESLSAWTKAYTDNVKAYDGRTASIMNELGDFVTPEQEEEMLALEETIKHAQTIKEQEEAIERFNIILEDINNYRYQVEAELLAAQEQYQEPANYSGGGGSTNPFKSQGVIYWNDTRYTWYSQNVLPGGGLDIPGRHVGEGDLIYDGDGYIVVASSDYAYGTTVETPFGEGRVYDTGCDSGTIDIYTNF